MNLKKKKKLFSRPQCAINFTIRSKYFKKEDSREERKVPVYIKSLIGIKSKHLWFFLNIIFRIFSEK